jgi:diguanylate cyclase (GGDEF)-like protein
LQLTAARVTYNSGLSWSMSDIQTQREVLRHTAKRMAIAVSLTAVMTLATVTLQLGTDLDAVVRVGHVLTLSLCAAIAISAFLSGALSYRSALLMKELTLTRAELFRISRTDKLTGLLNRRGFDEAAAVALQSAHAAKRPVAAMMCDIDHFKAINDHYGHEFGDRVLVNIGEVLQAFAADNELLVARYGGEEFAVLAVGITEQQAAILGEALRQGCCARDVVDEDNSARITISIGLAAPVGIARLSQLMRVADEALYLAKRQGRNCVARAIAVSDSLAA